MRITQTVLKKYLELEAKEKAIAKEREALRLAMLAEYEGKADVELGSFRIKIDSVSRTQAKPYDEVVEELGQKIAKEVFRTVSFRKLKVVKER